MFRAISCFVCLALLGLALVAPNTQASLSCSEITGTTHTTGGTLDSMSGTADSTIGGESRPATITASITDFSAPNADGVREAKILHRFDFGDGDSFSTSGQATLTPSDTAGMYRLTSPSRMTEGAGSYAESRGQVMLRGEVNLDRPESNLEVHGTICN